MCRLNLQRNCIPFQSSESNQVARHEISNRLEIRRFSRSRNDTKGCVFDNSDRALRKTAPRRFRCRLNFPKSNSIASGATRKTLKCVLFFFCFFFCIAAGAIRFVQINAFRISMRFRGMSRIAAAESRPRFGTTRNCLSSYLVLFRLDLILNFILKVGGPSRIANIAVSAFKRRIWRLKWRA